MYVKRLNSRFFVNIKNLWSWRALNGILPLPFTIHRFTDEIERIHGFQILKRDKRYISYCECTVLEKVRMQTLGFARMETEQIKEARLSEIPSVRGKDSSITPYENERYGTMGHLAKIYIYIYHTATIAVYIRI